MITHDVEGRQPLPARFHFHYEFADRWFDFAAGLLLEHIEGVYWDDPDAGKYGGGFNAVVITIGITWLHVQISFRTRLCPASDEIKALMND